MTTPTQKPDAITSLILTTFSQCVESHLGSPRRDPKITGVVREALTPDPASPRFEPDSARQRLSRSRQLSWEQATDAAVLVTGIVQDCRSCIDNDKLPREALRLVPKK